MPHASDIAAYLKNQDPILGCHINKSSPVKVVPDSETSLFQALVKSIIGQQLSVKAAATIFGRVRDEFGISGIITPEKMKNCSPEGLRACGVSGTKGRTLISTAEKICNGNIPQEHQMHTLSDADIMNALMQVKGIGRWTAEMILIFKLGRQDVMPVADLGVQKGYAIIFKLKARPLPKAILQRSQLWKPYRSTATLHCWQALDTQT